LPDGLFSYPKSKFGKFLVGLGMEKSVYFMTIWYNLWSFGIVCCHLVYFVVIWCIFSRLVCLKEEKSGNPAATGISRTAPKSVFSANLFYIVRVFFSLSGP
jgi:hypothetical protein